MLAADIAAYENHIAHAISQTPFRRVYDGTPHRVLADLMVEILCLSEVFLR
jgi:hypothetical protein